MSRAVSRQRARIEFRKYGLASVRTSWFPHLWIVAIPTLHFYGGKGRSGCTEVFLQIRGFVQRRIASFANRRAYGSAAKTFVRLPAVPGRAVVLRIETPMASRPFGSPSLTPAAFTALPACALRLPRGKTGKRASLLFPSSLHGVLAVKVCACLARWRPGGRLSNPDGCAAPCGFGLGQFRPASF